ncbi:hypothetical protein [Lacrimispora amygdalina]|uniref:hypothetical protein n=1 Tax=Lacrimispora amygdalina TaxID=253257 RepID=UPI000BE3E184|nr:hypothetical protein [Lacrimispora amygdalina]
MKNLIEIEKELNKIAKLKEPLKTRKLVQLMNYMEAYYKVFIINPTKEQMEKPEVKLYEKISAMRDI